MKKVTYEELRGLFNDNKNRIEKENGIGSRKNLRSVFL